MKRKTPSKEMTVERMAVKVALANSALEGLKTTRPALRDLSAVSRKKMTVEEGIRRVKMRYGV